MRCRGVERLFGRFCASAHPSAGRAGPRLTRARLFAVEKLSKTKSERGGCGKPDQQRTDPERGAANCGIGRLIGEEERAGKMPLAWSECDPARDQAKADENREADQILYGAHPARSAGGYIARRGIGVYGRLEGYGD